MSSGPRIRTVSALLLDEGGKIVIQLRDDKPDIPFPNCWSTLGGGVEPDETPDQAVRRELMEEIEFCPPLRFWKTFDLDALVGGALVQAEIHTYVGALGRELSQVNLHEGQRLGAFGADEIDGLAFAFGLDRLLRAFFAEQERLV